MVSSCFIQMAFLAIMRKCIAADGGTGSAEDGEQNAAAALVIWWHLRKVFEFSGLLSTSMRIPGQDKRRVNKAVYLLFIFLPTL